MSWSDWDDGYGLSFEHEDGRTVEIYETNGGRWAADACHKYGCTRLLLGDKSDALEAGDRYMRTTETL
jgi:hypothetical protein